MPRNSKPAVTWGLAHLTSTARPTRRRKRLVGGESWGRGAFTIDTRPAGREGEGGRRFALRAEPPYTGVHYSRGLHPPPPLSLDPSPVFLPARRPGPALLVPRCVHAKGGLRAAGGGGCQSCGRMRSRRKDGDEHALCFLCSSPSLSLPRGLALSPAPPSPVPRSSECAGVGVVRLGSAHPRRLQLCKCDIWACMYCVRVHLCVLPETSVRCRLSLTSSCESCAAWRRRVHSHVPNFPALVR